MSVKFRNHKSSGNMEQTTLSPTSAEINFCVVLELLWSVGDPSDSPPPVQVNYVEIDTTLIVNFVESFDDITSVSVETLVHSKTSRRILSLVSSIP